MFDVTTGNAAKPLPVPGLGGDVPAFGAGLRTVGSGHLDEAAAAPKQLVAEHRSEDASVEAALLRDVAARVLDRAGCASDHVLDAEPFDHDSAVALGVACRLDVENVVALSPNLPMQLGDSEVGLCSFSTPLPFPGSASLGPSQTLRCRLVVFRIDDEPAVAVRQQVVNSTVNGDDGFGASRGIDLDLAQDRREPLPGLATQRATLRLAFERTVDDGSKVPEFREADLVRFQSPYFRMRLAECQAVTPLPLPTREPRDAFEAALERLVEFDEQLGADVPRHVREPGKFGPELRQLVDLVERGGVDLVGSSEAHQPLLKREVPEPPQRTFPRHEPSDLFLAGVDAVAEGSVADHESVVARNLTLNKETALLPTLNSRVSVPEMRRTQDLPRRAPGARRNNPSISGRWDPARFRAQVCLHLRAHAGTGPGLVGSSRLYTGPVKGEKA